MATTVKITRMVSKYVMAEKLFHDLSLKYSMKLVTVSNNGSLRNVFMLSVLGLS